MTHEIVVEGQRRALDGIADLGRAESGPLLRVQRRAGGGAVVIASADALRDGTPLLGRFGIVNWGEGALVRVGGLRVEIAWRSGAEQRAAAAGERCRLCFGTFADGETVAACGCEVAFHDECDRRRVNCPGCGAPREPAAL